MVLSQIQQPAGQSALDLPSGAKALRGIRILFLADEIQSLSAGGTERQILQIISICKNIGMEPHLCFMRRTRWLTQDLAGCPVSHFDIEKLASPHAFASFAKLSLWIKSQRFHILQNFFSEANLIGPVVGRMARVPVILGTRRNLNHPRHVTLERSLLRIQSRVNGLVDMIIANSGAVLEKIVETEGVRRDRICVVYNGIDLNHMRPRPDLRAAARKALGLQEHHLLVGNISGLRRIKGVMMFLEAAAKAAARDPRLRFLLIGDGEMKDELLESVRFHKLQDIFWLAGAADDVRPHLAAFDIGVLCSHAEGFSNSLLEYMASGVPAIATDVGGNREALGPCGLLIPPDADALANAIHAASDSRLRAHFAAAALDRVRMFDIDLATRRNTDIYASFIHQIGLGRGSHVQKIAHSRPPSCDIAGT